MKRIWLCSPDARRILALRAAGGKTAEVSLDLNLTVLQAELKPKGIETRGIIIDWPDIEFMAREREKIFFLDPGDQWLAAEIRSRGYYKLFPTPEAPTLEIDGIRMHRTRDINPFEDSRLKAQSVVRASDRVLDTCGGMLYTAVWALKLGAAGVVSIERDENVLALRAGNPWTMDYDQDPRLELRAGDAASELETIPAGTFDSVIHDPPRFSLAGELYGSAFYSRLHEVLKPGGRLFHYTGKPYSKGRGRDFVGGVKRRLSSAGFRDVKWSENLQGITARND